MAALHEKVVSGDFKNVRKDSIRQAVEQQCEKLTDVHALLASLKGGKVVQTRRPECIAAWDDNPIISYAYKPGDSSVSEDTISALREAFERVDAAGITKKKYTPLFNGIVELHQHNMKEVQKLEKQRAALLGHHTNG
ncbi:MAG: hypothetical protein R3E13_02295 [Alphaproteobacteria bacterium]